LSEPRSSLKKTVIERFVAVVRSKNASPTWSNIRAALLHFDRAGLLGLVQDLYAASKDNQAFLHARLGLGHDQLQPFKARISNWICPDVMKKPTHIDLKSQEGDCRLQESD
jgi:predicted secreted hydrolase